MVKSVRIYRQDGFYSAVGHPEIEGRRYLTLDSLVIEIYCLDVSPFSIDFSDIDKTFSDYECN